MGAAVNLEAGITLEQETMLELRYLLHSHSGAYDHQQAELVHQEFVNRPRFIVSKSTKPHHQYELSRASH